MFPKRARVFPVHRCFPWLLTNSSSISATASGSTAVLCRFGTRHQPAAADSCTHTAPTGKSPRTKSDKHPGHPTAQVLLSNRHPTTNPNGVEDISPGLAEPPRRSLPGVWPHHNLPAAPNLNCKSVFRRAWLTVANSSNPVWQGVTNSVGGTAVSGSRYVPKAGESLTGSSLFPVAGNE